ncbi:MAG: methyltransferase domain-containing protein, partial [Promethearchaeota archaeon]
MKLDTLDIMICPECQSHLEVLEILRQEKEKIINGIVKCKCCEYPILDEILIFEKPDPSKHVLNTKYLIELLRTGRGDAAVALPLEGKILDNLLLKTFYFLERVTKLRKPLFPFLSLVRHIKKRRYREYFGENMSFFDLMDRYKPNMERNFLKHRFSTDSLWTIYPFIPLLKQKNDTLLNIGGEAGHFNYLIENKVSPEKLICMNNDYTLLHISKRFFCKDADLICSDLEGGIPLKNDSCSSILFLESNKHGRDLNKEVVEIKRVLKHNGLLLASYQYRDLSDSEFQAGMLDIPELEGIFDDLPHHLVPNQSLLEDFLKRFELDLSKEYGKQALKDSDSLTVIGTRDINLFTNYSKLNRYLEENIKNAIINP